MSKKANPAFIGIFVIGAIVLGVVAIMVFGSGQLFKKTETFVVYFDDSVNGLDIGAPVKLKGVPIGQVSRIQIRFNQEDASPHIPVFIQMDSSRLKNSLNVDIDLADPATLRKQVEVFGLRAQLQQASFVTGLLFIELNYYPDSSGPTYIQQSQPGTNKKKYPEIPTVSSGLTEVIKKVSLMVDQISKIDFATIGKQVDGILSKLDSGLEDIQFKALNDQALTVLDDLNEFLSNPETQAVPANLNLTLAEGMQFINHLDDEVGPLVNEINLTVESARNTLEAYQSLARSADRVLEPDSSFQLKLETALREFAGASRSIRILADYLERNPSALFSGKGK